MSVKEDREIIEEYKLNPNQDTGLAFCNMVNNSIKRMEAYVALAEAVDQMQANAVAADVPTQIIVCESDWITLSVAMAAIEGK